MPATIRPLSGALVGISLETPGGYTADQWLTAHETLLGRSVDLPCYYHLWDTSQPSSDKTVRAAAGQVPVISWQGRRNNASAVGWANIAAGSEDALIDARAAAFAAAPGQYMISFENEPEDLAPTNGAHSDYVAAFQRIVTRFRSAGVTNVHWLYVAMGVMTTNKQNQVLASYPGDDYVDWVGFDPYNWYDTPGRGNPWLSFEDMVSPWYGWATTNLTNRRPYMLREFGSVVDSADPARRRAWFRQAADAIERRTFPQLRALCYFDHPRPPGSGEWTLGTGADFDAYRAMTERLRSMRLIRARSGGQLRQKPLAGQYANVGNAAGTGTSNTLGGGNIRVYPWLLYDRARIDRIGAEVTVAGTAGSLARLVIYGDNGSGRPGDLVLDAGTIDGATVARAQVTVNQLLEPGIYWVGAVLQGTLTSQPTLRTVNPPVELPGVMQIGTGLPGAGDGTAGYTDSSGLTNLPTTFTSSPGNAGSAPRIFVRFAEV